MNTDLFRSVPRKKATEHIIEEIQALIIASKLSPGDKLPSERELAEKFSVSRNVLREALSVLGQRGLVTVLAGKGTVVSQPSIDSAQDMLSLLLQLRHVSLTELCDARLIIEPELASLAASLPETADMGRLQEMGKLLLEHSDDPETHVQADMNFHEEIANLAGHGVLSVIVGAVREPVTRSMTFGTKIPRAIGSSDEQHFKIMDAILRRDPHAARLAMADHIRYVSEYIRDNDVELTDWSTG